MKTLSQIIQGLFRDIAIDIGTTNIRSYLKNSPEIRSEPAIVAINNSTGQILAVGQSAKEMQGKNPSNINIVQPLKHGVVSDFNATESLIHYTLEKLKDGFTLFDHLLGGRVTIGVPSVITEVEINALVDSAKSAGARIVKVVEQPMAAAAGNDLPIGGNNALMVVDIGGGTTDIAIIAMNSIIIDNTVKIGGETFDEAIISYVKSKYNLLIGKSSAEQVKITLATAIPPKKEEELEIKGQDIISGLPKTLKITNSEVYAAIFETLSNIANSVKEAVEKAPPEIFPDIIDSGILLTGGCSQIKGIKEFLQNFLNIKVSVSNSHSNSVMLGLKKIILDKALLEKICIKDFILK